GSEMSGGVRNVWMHDCVLESEALRLFYVKTNERRGGFVEDIRMENVTAKKVRRGVMAVETDVLYQWRDFPTHEVRVTPIRNLSMKNVAVDEAERLVDIRGDKRLPVDGVTLENVRVAKALKPDRIENAVNVVVNAEGEAAAHGFRRRPRIRQADHLPRRGAGNRARAPERTRPRGEVHATVRL
ncbi:MAG: hypothetical protein IIY62_01535, partial [Kiritimatiellae bacterium]|nr:hypothetical protein [Kiritimatiellia bacterium]